MHPELKENLLFMVKFGLPVIVISLGLAFLVGYFEAPVNPSFADPSYIIWWWASTISTVGYGDITPVSNAGHFFGILLIFFSLIFITLIIAESSNIFKILAQYKSKGYAPIKYRDHVVIIGYNSLTNATIDMFRNRYGKDLDIVLMSNILDKSPRDDIAYISGDPLDREILIKAHVSRARVVMVMTNDLLVSPDTYTLVVGLQVEKFAPKVVTIGELRNPEMRSIFKYTKMDHIIWETSLIDGILKEDKEDEKKLFKILDYALKD